MKNILLLYLSFLPLFIMSQDKTVDVVFERKNMDISKAYSLGSSGFVTFEGYVGAKGGSLKKYSNSLEEEWKVELKKRGSSVFANPFAGSREIYIHKVEEENAFFCIFKKSSKVFILKYDIDNGNVLDSAVIEFENIYARPNGSGVISENFTVRNNIAHFTEIVALASTAGTPSSDGISSFRWVTVDLKTFESKSRIEKRLEPKHNNKKLESGLVPDEYWRIVGMNKESVYIERRITQKDGKPYHLVRAYPFEGAYEEFKIDMSKNELVSEIITSTDIGEKIIFYGVTANKKSTGSYTPKSLFFKTFGLSGNLISSKDVVINNEKSYSYNLSKRSLSINIGDNKALVQFDVLDSPKTYYYSSMFNVQELGSPILSFTELKNNITIQNIEDDNGLLLALANSTEDKVAEYVKGKVLSEKKVNYSYLFLELKDYSLLIEKYINGGTGKRIVKFLQFNN